MGIQKLFIGKMSLMLLNYNGVLVVYHVEVYAWSGSGNPILVPVVYLYLFESLAPCLYFIIDL